MAADGPAIGRLGGRALRRPLIIVVAALAALFGCPMLPAAVVRAEGEAGNAAPDATDDVVVAPAAGATVTLRGIDTDGDDLTFGVLSPSGVTLGDVSTPSCETPAGGPRVCTATVDVTPAGGTGSFDFTVSDPAVTATATVTVVNSAPAAVDDSVVAAPGSATTITLRALDPEGDALSFATFSPSGGSVGEVGTPSCAAQPDGSSACTAQVTFTNTSASGSFGYTASDGVNVPQEASVAVANPRPAALDDSLVAAAGSVTTVTLRGIDPNGDALSFATFSPSGGTLGEVGTPSCAAQPDGSSVCTADVTFTNVSGNGTFGYTVSDGVNDPQQASVAVANPRPAALDDSLVAAAGSVTTVTLRGIDPNGDALSFATFSPSGGTLGEVGTPSCAAQPDGSSVCTADVTFTNVSGNGTFGYTVSDGVNDPQQASVAVANPRPAALDDSLVAAAGSVTTVTLRGIDPNGDALSFATFSPSGGTLGEVGTPSCAAQPDGSSVCTADVTFTNVSGNGTFGYTVSDGVNDPQQASVAVANPAPAALPDAITGATGPVDVMLRGVDANGDPLTFEVFGASGGTLGEVGMPSCSGQPDGSSVCTATVPFTNSSGDGSFFFVVQDGSSTSPPAVVIVSAAAGSSNSAPVVTTSSAGVRAAGSAVTLHGADSDGDSLSFEISSPSGLTVGALAPSACSPAADGSSVCTGDVLVTPSVATPGSSFVGSFSYRANDGDATSSFQTVTVTNPSPEAISTTAPVPTAGGNVTLRGADPNGDPLTFEVSSASDVSLGTPSEPVCTPQPDGSSLCTAEVMVTPAPTALSSSWSGSFAYRVIDGSSTSSFETVTVSNPSPEAISDDALVPIAGGALTLRGTDPNGDPLTFELGSSSALTVGPIGEPTCTPTGDGSMSCVAAVAVNPLAPTPSASWSGSLAYRVNDGSSTSSFETITVGNASPAAADDHVVVPAAGGTATLLAADASGDDVTFEVGSASGVIVGSPGPTSCATSGATSRCIAEVTVTPVTEGTLSTTWGGSFTYRSLDGASLSPFGTITVVNPSPETTPAQVSSDTVGTTVTLRGADANGDPLTFEVGGSSGATVSPPGAPACSPGGDGSARCQATVPVTPTERAWSFSYRASDGLSVSPFQSVTGTNARPSAAPLALPVPSTASTVTLTGIDANGDALTFAIASPPADATLGEIGDPTCTNRPDGSSLCTADVAFTPGAGDSWSFSYTVDDGVGPSFTATAFLVRASGADEPPLAVSTGVGLLPGANAITLQGSDPEGADVTFAIAAPPASGTLGPIGPVSCADGTCTATVTYTPDDATVDDSFTFRANDGTLDSEPATVSLSGNAPPIAHGMSLNYTADTPLPFQLVGSDAESQPLTFALTAGPTHGTLSALSAPDCSFGSCTVDVTYTPNAGYDGNDSITFSVSDGTHPAVEASVTLIGNQAPLAVAGSAKIVAPATTLVLEGFDAELATLEFSVSTAPTFGTLALDGQPSCDGFGMCTQTATYTPSPGSTDPDAFEFTVSDGSNSSEPAMFTLVRDEPPIAVDDSVTVIGSVPAAIFPLSNDFDSTSDPLTITAYDQTGTAGGAVACDPFGECTYTPAAGFFGTDTFTYEISDGTFTDTATVTVIVRGAAIISNGTVTLGVWGEGHLNVPGPDRPVGLRYEPTGNESTAPGCECEGWGVADATTATAGYANESTDGGPVNLELVSFTSDASTATSVVDVDDVLRVTHAYRPSATSPNLYEVAVTIENRSAAPVEPRYRRVMDWDVEPTPFSEFVTIETGTASGILFTSDNGFASANPLGPRGQIAFTGEAVDSGPADHGALFDFGFDTLAPGASMTFTTYYGAAGAEVDALDALQAVEAEAYSLGQSSTEDGPTLGTPSTFVFGFTGIGGASAFEPVAVAGDDVTVAEGATVALDASASSDPDGTITSYSWTPAAGIADPAAAVTSYVPADDGAQVITLQVCDDDEPARCGTDSRTVTATNVAPSVVAAGDVVTDTGTVSIDPIATYSDPGSADTHTAVIDWGDGSVADGPAAVTGGGVVGTHTYLSNGVFTVQVCVTDDDGGTACDALQVTVAGVENLAPTAFSAEFDIESPTTALVLGGFDAELATLSFAVATGPLNGNVSLDGPVTCDGFGTCTRPATYTPDPGSTGDDSFTFTVFDGTTTSAPATVTLIGNRPPEPGTPFVQPERAIGPTTLTVRVADPDGDPLTVTLGTGPEHGVLGALSAPSCTVEDDGSSSCAVTVLYTPEAGFVGIDQFTIVVDDGVNAPETLFVAIRVGNTAPIAKTDVIITDPGTAGSVDVLGNDRDADGDLLTLDAVGDAAHGEVSCVEDSGPIVCTYTPDAGYTGGDEFTYTIADGFGATATATVEVTVHSGGSGVEPTDCPTVASALDGGMVAGEHWVACSSPTANGIARELSTLLDPPAGGSAVLLTSGDRAIAPGPSYGQGEGRSNGTNLRGAHDVSVLAVDLVIPAPATCLRFDVVFMSDEYPEFVGSSYNDAFLAEIDETTWSVSGSTITAPNNFAFDPNGKELSINSTFFQSARVIEPAESGVAYDGSTERLVVQTPITPGPHTLFLTIFDASDSILDTAALVDNLRAVVAGDEGCAAGANQPPTATDATVTTAEDTPVSFEVTADDADGDELTVLGLSDPAIGSVAADGAVSCIDGACTIPLRYVPDANAHGTDTFTVTVSDGNGGTATATVTVTVTPVADVPIAADVAVTTNEDVAVDIPLIGSDADGDALSFAVTGDPLHGAVVCVGTACTYTPAANFAGTDTFTYTVTDPGGLSDTATVTITVRAVNDAPVALDDTATTPEDTAVAVAVLGNDSDVDGDSLTVVAVGAPSAGSAMIVGGNVVYTPAANFHGTDSFTYTVMDPGGLTAAATVTITVTPVNDAPEANPDAAEADGAMVSVDVLANDTDVDGDDLSVSGSGTTAAGGTFTCATPMCSYTAPAGFAGTDTFTYTLSDGNGATATGTVTITVIGGGPTGDDLAVTTVEDTPVEATLTGSDPAGDPLSFAVTGGPAHGAVVCVGASCTYTPAASFHGIDTFTYTVTDPGGLSDTATVTITVTPVADAPIAADVDVTTNEDAAVDIPLIGSDADGDALSFAVTGGPAHGAVVCVGASCTYTPAANFHGIDTFTYTVTDPGGLSDTATVTITVRAVNDAPVALDDTATTPEDTAVAVAVLGNDSDVDGDSLTVVAVGAPSAGSAMIVGGNVVYTPAANFHGTDSFTYTVMDPGGLTAAATVTITVTPVNDGPVASDITVTAAEDTALDITLAGGDLDGDALSFAVTDGPAHGTLTCDGASCTYSPAPNFNGTDTVTFTVTDPGGLSDTATVTITVSPVNDAPVVVGAGGLTVAEGASVSLTASVTDVDSTIFTYSWSPAAGLNSQTAAAPTFTAVDDGTYPFAVTVCDDATPAVCTSVADAVVVTVSNVVPTVTASAPLSASVGVAVSAVVSSYTDPGLVDTHSATIDWGDGTAPDGPVAVTDGSIAGTHSFASPGTYTVTVCVTDDDGGTACATTTATVTSGLPVLSIGDTSVEEGDSGLQTLVFTIALSAPTTQAVRVGWLTWPGTATEGTGTILDPEDYRAASGTARIPAGATSVTVRVQVAGDLVAEGPETLFVDLELPVNAVIGDGRGVGTILDGDDSCTVVGTSASEVLVGTDGDDVLCGLRGDDVYDPRGGDDTIVDTGGSDTITYAQAPAGVVVDLAAGAATGWGSDTFGGIERAIGSEHDDELLGSDAADELTGLGGDDHLVGLGRDDTLLGGDGDDEFDGGEGGDLMRGGAGSDSVVGGGGNDFVIAGDGDDTVDAGAGADSVFGDGGADDLQGGDGNDTMSGGDGDDRVGGGAGRDLLRGDGGNDHLLGDAGNDVLEGGEGNDVLEGGANDDRLDGGPGDDRSDGGAAKDTCAAGGPADLLIGCEST